MRYTGLVPPHPTSDRLRFAPLDDETFATFLELVREAHVRRFLFDGKTLSDVEARQFVDDAHSLWLVYEPLGSRPAGFGGFRKLGQGEEDLQLFCALTKPYTGMGLGTELVEALVRFDRATPTRHRIVVEVDEPNTVTVRIVEKVGFQRQEERDGHFGRLFVYELTPG